MIGTPGSSLDTALDRRVTSYTYHQYALRRPPATSLVHERPAAPLILKDLLRAGRPPILASASGAALFDQTELARVGRYLSARGEAELLDRARTVGLDRTLGDVQLLGDLRVGVAVGDQAHNLALAL
jgi:hypothetical protein